MHNDTLSPPSERPSEPSHASVDDWADVHQQQAKLPRRRLAVLRKTAYPWLSLSVLVLVIDQLTKAWVTNNLDYAEVNKFLPFLNITLVHNLGAAFSFLADAGGWQRWFFAGVSGIISLILFIWITRTPRDGHHLQAAALASILGGALGNLWDRLDYGYVIDFIDFYIGKWHWPAFNFADSAITIGAILLLLQIMFEKKPED
jgi:signal peptidase II